jgi:hypothetical protein
MIFEVMTGNNYINEKYPLSDLTGKITKCAVEEHLKTEFRGIIYPQVLAI